MPFLHYGLKASCLMPSDISQCKGICHYHISHIRVCGYRFYRTSVRTVNTASDLGVVVDSHLMTTMHVSAVCREAYYQLRQLCPLISSLSSDAAKLLVQAFISTCLDYCNSLLYGISDNLYRHLQAVQNATARLITNTRRCKHITPVMQQLHWLPVRHVQFKIAVLVYKALHDLLPAYLAGRLA